MPGMLVTLRPVADTATDQEFLLQLFVSTRTTTFAGLLETEITNLLGLQFKGQCHQYRHDYPNATREIILLDGCPVGRQYLDRSSAHLHLLDLSLLPEYRLRGIGGRLLTELIRESERKGLPLTLQVDVDNPISGYYQRLGFVERARRGFYRCLQRWPEQAAPGGFGD